MAIRITHAAGEVLRDGSPSVRITHVAGEVLRDGDPSVRITHAIGEVLRLVVAAGWTGKICGVTNPSKICGVATSSVEAV